MDTTIQEEVEKFISTAWDQITDQSNSPSGDRDSENTTYFTQQFHHAAVQHGLSEGDALEVYRTGEPIEEDKIVRVYAEYEIGISYFLDSQNGRVVITSIWKQELR